MVFDDRTSIGVGPGALRGNRDGRSNTAVGADSLHAEVSGNDNTAIGYQALVNSEGSANIAIGALAGSHLNKGDRNIYLGNPGTDNEEGVIRIGEDGLQTRTFIAGIANVTTGDKSAAVVIDQYGQLGTISSSRRYKQEIEPMAGFSDRVLDLRPVTFRYKEATAAGDRPLQFGLVAEEVAGIFPELVVYNTHGQPETVAYHLLAPLLLNELQKEHALNARHGEELARQRQAIEDMQMRLAAMESAMNQAVHAAEPGP